MINWELELNNLYLGLDKQKIKRYTNFIKYFEGKEDKKYNKGYHNHHPIPLSLNKGYKDYTIKLSIRAHFISHLLLYSLFRDSNYIEEKRKSLSALYFMSTHFTGTSHSFTRSQELNKEQNILNKKLQQEKARLRWREGFYNSIDFSFTKGRIRIYNKKNNKEKVIEKKDFPIFNKEGWELGRLPFSKEIRKKMSEKKIGKGCLIKNMDTNEIFSSIREASKKYKINHISECCRGKRKTAGGYHWGYYEK